MYNNYQNRNNNLHQHNTYGGSFNNTNESTGGTNNLSQDPRLSNVSPVKLKIIKEIAEKSKGKSIEEMLPQIMKVNKELQARNISFTKEETALLLEVIEETLPPKDKAKFNMLKGFLM